jgi:spore maturation protein CgeB
MPHALNPALYRRIAEIARDIDVGFVGARYPLFIGDTERSDAIDRVAARARELGLQVDLRHVNVPREEWVRFLNRCHGVVGGEAGTRYLDRTGRLIPEVEAWLREHPNAGFDEVFARFFRDRPVVMSGKAISSRHFEPVGTETCQLLLEGEYNGILRPDEHYIALRKDLTNVDDALARLCDAAYRTEMTRRTLEYVLSAHTYRHRIRELFARVLG